MANDTRLTIRTEIRRDLRDPDGKTWSNDEINDLINAGIDAISDLSPIEDTDTFTAIFPYSAGSNFGKALEFTPSKTFKNIFRVDVYDGSSRFYETIPVSTGGESDNGWQFWGGKVIMPTYYSYPTTIVGSAEQVTLKIWGYRRHTLFTNDNTASDLTDAEKNAVRIYAQAEALQRLMIDRADFQQWQIASGASDITISELSVLASSARTRWRAEAQRIRKMRQIA
jgi:hypothetical protein